MQLRFCHRFMTVQPTTPTNRPCAGAAAARVMNTLTMTSLRSGGSVRWSHRRVGPKGTSLRNDDRHFGHPTVLTRASRQLGPS